MQVEQANFSVDRDFYLCHSGSLYTLNTGTCLLRKCGFQEFIYFAAPRGLQGGLWRPWFPTKDWTRAFVAKWNINHWTAWEFPWELILFKIREGKNQIICSYVWGWISLPSQYPEFICNAEITFSGHFKIGVRECWLYIYAWLLSCQVMSNPLWPHGL